MSKDKMTRADKVFNTLVGASVGLALLTLFLFITAVTHSLLGRTEKASESAEAVCYLLIPTLITSVAAYHSVPMEK